jgi:hypothetical protein
VWSFDIKSKIWQQNSKPPKAGTIY